MNPGITVNEAEVKKKWETNARGWKISVEKIDNLIRPVPSLILRKRGDNLNEILDEIAIELLLMERCQEAWGRYTRRDEVVDAHRAYYIPVNEFTRTRQAIANFDWPGAKSEWDAFTFFWLPVHKLPEFSGIHEEN